MDHNGYDVIIVLGAQVRPEGVASEALKRRLSLAYRHYLKSPAPILCCGGKGRDEPMAEGDFMCGWLQAHGVPEPMTISENKSRNTDENIKNAKAIMLEKGLRFALVITSDYHIKRALAICGRYGIKATGDGSESLRRYWLKNNARELLAWVKFHLKL